MNDSQIVHEFGTISNKGGIKMSSVSIGDTVKAHYRSGTYLGEVMEDRGQHFLIEVQAVYKHPLQGDLHNMMKTENVFFHERKALAYHEKMNVKKPAVHPYTSSVPNYNESLKQAIETYREKLQEKDTKYNRLALETLHRLEQEVYSKVFKGS